MTPEVYESLALYEAKKEIDIQNRPIRAHNAKVHHELHQRIHEITKDIQDEYERKEKVSLLRYEMKGDRKPLIQYPKHIQEFSDNEIEQAARLRERSPIEWRHLIDKIEDLLVRNQVAKIIWWDYFAHRTPKEAWKHLDEYIESPDIRVEPSDLHRELVKLGFTQHAAYARMSLNYYK